jgi:outer membrane protein assembly factor BamB
VRWTASLGGEVGSVASVGDLVIVASADRAATVTALDASSGDERWTARLGRRDSLGELFVVGDAVAATTTGRIPSLQVIDAATGQPRWERRLRTGDRVVEIGDTLAVVDSVNENLRITALDPVTGTAFGSLDDPTRFGDGAYVRIEGTTVDVYDEHLRALARDVELGEVPVDVTVVDDVVLVTGSGRLRAVELDGRERWSMPIDPAGGRVVVPSGAGEGQALVMSSTATTAVDVRGADPVVRWSADGSPVLDPSAPGTRFVPLQTSGREVLDVVDLTDGSVTSTIDVAGGVVLPLYGVDGLVLARPAGDDTWQIEGLDYRSGAVRWQTDVLGDPTLVERGVVGVRAEDDGITVTYVGAG